MRSPATCWTRRCSCRWWLRSRLKLDGKNLLDSPYRMIQGDVLRSRYTTGRLFEFAFTWHL